MVCTAYVVLLRLLRTVHVPHQHMMLPGKHPQPSWWLVPLLSVLPHTSAAAAPVHSGGSSPAHLNAKDTTSNTISIISSDDVASQHQAAAFHAAVTVCLHGNCRNIALHAGNEPGLC
jgi:hypothetical protein